MTYETSTAAQDRRPHGHARKAARHLIRREKVKEPEDWSGFEESNDVTPDVITDL